MLNWCHKWKIPCHETISHMKLLKILYKINFSLYMEYMKQIDFIFRCRSHAQDMYFMMYTRNVSESGKISNFFTLSVSSISGKGYSICTKNSSCYDNGIHQNYIKEMWTRSQGSRESRYKTKSMWVPVRSPSSRRLRGPSGSIFKALRELVVRQKAGLLKPRTVDFARNTSFQ